MVMFVVSHTYVHACAVDGFSRKIVDFVTMPVKKVKIYDNFFRLLINNFYTMKLKSIPAQ